MDLTRRQFLKGFAATALALGISVPAFSSNRNPYVSVGEVVDYIGPHPAKLCIGLWVKEVGLWDGTGYPVVVEQGGYYGPKPPLAICYDCDLAVMHKEYPANIWHDPENRRKYPNVHTYIRMKRFGETAEEAIRKLNFASTERWLKEGWAW